MNPDGSRPTVDWEELNKTKFYSYGLTFFLGVRVLLYPPFLIKTKMQVDRGQGSVSALGVVKTTVRREGARGLYKGFWVSSGGLVFRQLYFTTYEVIRHRLGPESEFYRRLGPDAGDVARTMLAGAGSSTVMQVFTVPFDIIGQRMMVDSGRGSTPPPSSATAPGASTRDAPLEVGIERGKEAAVGRGEGHTGERLKRITARQVARQVYTESGLAGFYRGFGVSVLQFAPTSAIWWTAYGLYIRTFLRILGRFPRATPGLTEEQRLAGAQAAAGLCTGMTTVVITNPLDVLRTRLQVEGRRGDNRTLVSEYRSLLRDSGPAGLMRGLWPRVMAMAPASVLVVSVYELIKRLSRKTHARATSAALT